MICIEKDLSLGNVDKKNFAEKSKEYSDLNEIVGDARNYISFHKNKVELEKILLDQNADEELKKLAEIELSDLKINYENSEKKLKCSIEQAWLDGKTNFRKPISCHLYPIRISQLQEYETLNYDRWSICECARILGKNKGIAIYKFLKKPLIRKYGKVWYQKLCDEIELLKSET